MRRSPGTIASEIGRGDEQHSALTCWRSVVERISYYNAKRLLEAPGTGIMVKGGKRERGGEVMKISLWTSEGKHCKSNTCIYISSVGIPPKPLLARPELVVLRTSSREQGQPWESGPSQPNNAAAAVPLPPRWLRIRWGSNVLSKNVGRVVAN